MAFNYTKNLAQSSLASGYTAGGSSITVQTGDGSKFDAANFVVALGNPPQFFLEVTAVSGDTFTVNTSGYDGSTPVSVTSGTPVTEVITGGVLTALLAAAGSVSIGARASLPGSVPPAGSYDCTDSPYRYVSNGSSWVPLVFGYKVSEPILSNFTQTNVSATTFDTSHGGIIMQVTPPGGDSVQQLRQSLPSAPYYIDAAFTLDSSLSTATNAGVAVSDGTKLSIITFGTEGSSTLYVKRIQYNSASSFNNNSSGASRQMSGPLIWLRIYDDGTDLNYYFGTNGYEYELLLSEARTAFLTPSVGAFCVNAVNSSPPMNVHLVHFSIHT